MPCKALGFAELWNTFPKMKKRKQILPRAKQVSFLNKRKTLRTVLGRVLWEVGCHVPHLSNCYSSSTGSQRNPEATWRDNSAVLDRAPALGSKNPLGLELPHTADWLWWLLNQSYNIYKVVTSCSKTQARDCGVEDWSTCKMNSEGPADPVQGKKRHQLASGYLFDQPLLMFLSFNLKWIFTTETQTHTCLSSITQGRMGSTNYKISSSRL